VPAVSTALMFVGDQCGRAREALDQYVRVIPGAAVESLTLVDEGEQAGQVLRSVLSIGTAQLIVFDSAGPHQFTFTPAISVWLECDDADQFEAMAEGLVDGGLYLMPADDYGFSARFAWVQDRFGVSWQLNVARSA
jgi:predicted 3-demethylubiquinone-9 3-methyltransferase (glyoxalase superfamily)